MCYLPQQAAFVNLISVLIKYWKKIERRKRLLGWGERERREEKDREREE